VEAVQAVRLRVLEPEYKALVLFLALLPQRVGVTGFTTLVVFPEVMEEVAAAVVMAHLVVQAQVGRGMQGVLALLLEVLMAQEAAVGQALRV
jgi:hypothetical protein